MPPTRARSRRIFSSSEISPPPNFVESTSIRLVPVVVSSVALGLATLGFTLFGEALRQTMFGWATGLKPETQPAFAASVIFGNSVLLTYALWKQIRARGAA